MLSFLLRRLFFAVIVFFCVAFSVWLFTTHYGLATIDPKAQSASAFNPLSGITFQHSTSFLGWLGDVLHGDFGYSVSEREPIGTLIGSRIVVSLLLIVPALIVQETLGLALGIFMAARQGSAWQRLITNLQYFFSAMPSFWLSLMVIIFLAVDLHLFAFNGINDIRVSGASWNSPEYWHYFHTHTWGAILDIAAHLELPIIVLVLGNMVTDSQLIRVNMLEVLNQEYIRAARARGIAQRVILWRHALRNALLPYITSLGLQLPRIIFTAALVEFVFNLPGLGAFFIRSVQSQLPIDPGSSVDLNALHPLDPGVITAYLLIFGVMTLFATLVTDIAYALADPRIRSGD